MTILYLIEKSYSKTSHYLITLFFEDILDLIFNTYSTIIRYIFNIIYIIIINIILRNIMDLNFD